MAKYEAPSGSQVFWGEAKVRKLKNPTTINTSVQWDERNPETFLHRYAEGDTSDMRKGSWIVSYGVEQKGGEAYIEVKRWLEERGDTREPTNQEVVDWTLQRGNNAPAIGKPDGTKNNPFSVKDPRFPHGHKMEVKGKWYMNDLSPGSKAKGGFPDDGGGKPDPDPEPNYKEIVAKVRTRVQAVEVPSAGGKFAIQLRQLVNDLLTIVGKS